MRFDLIDHGLNGNQIICHIPCRSIYHIKKKLYSNSKRYSETCCCGAIENRAYEVAQNLRCDTFTGAEQSRQR